jgi:hypothetical protein
MPPGLRSLGVLASAVALVTSCVASCTTTTTGPSGYGGAAPTTVGSTGSATTTTTGPAYSYDGGPSTLPIIPETCTPDDAGCAGATGVEYQCPTDMDASDIDASLPVNCPSDPQNGIGPALYCCSNLCVPGCGDLPCPAKSCPATATLLMTCGPAMPDIEPGCTLIATRPSPQGLGERFSFCCASL